MKVQVTQDHINTGWRRSHNWCPIGNAIRGMDGICEVTVGANRIVWVTARSGSFEADTPARAEQFIKDFDNGRGVEPFEFDLEPKRFPR